MIEIIPAILPETFDEIEEAVSVVHTVAPTVQLDFVDGKYARNSTWWFNGKSGGEEKGSVLDKILREEKGFPFWQSVNYDFDLMIEEPLKNIDTFIALGPSRIIFHLESTSVVELKSYFETLSPVVKQIIRFGVALKVSDNPESIKELIPHINIIQIMGIKELGKQGEPFDENVYEYIERVKLLYPKMLLAVDGGIRMENVGKLAEKGITRFVIGSAVFKSLSPQSTIQEFKKLCEKKATAQESWE